MTVIKRDQKSSTADLIKALARFAQLLQKEDEAEAIADLNKASEKLKRFEPGSPEHKEAIQIIIDAFEGDHELNVYAHQSSKQQAEWTEADELSQASTRVLSLARRFK